MFDSRDSTGTKHTLTIALLLMAFVFSPAILLVSQPGLLSISMAAAGSGLCLVFAWLNSKRYADAAMTPSSVRPAGPR